MDGTLVNTEPLHFRAFHGILQRFQDEYKIDVDHESAIEKYYGQTDKLVYESLFPNKRPMSTEEFIQEKNNHLVEQFKSLSLEEKKPLLSPGIAAFLDHLKMTGATLALVSSSEERIVEATLECFDLKKYFDELVPRNGLFLNKPSASPYLKAMRALKAKSRDSLIFEDSPPGVMAGLRAGCFVIRYRYFSPKQGPFGLPQSCGRGVFLGECDNYSLLF